MNLLVITLIVAVVGSCSANLSGPYLLWGPENVLNLQPRALVEAEKQDFLNIYKNPKAIVVFLRNNTNRLDGVEYPKFQKLIKNSVWAYLPQHSLVAEPFNYNTNIEIINLSGIADNDDGKLVSKFNEIVEIFGQGQVLGILANQQEEAHYMSKRATKEGDEEPPRSSTQSTPTVDESEEGFIYIAKDRKAILYLNSAPLLNIANQNKSIKLVSHMKEIIFDDQKKKGRLIVPFKVDKDIDESGKIILRFIFTRIKGTWSVKAVEIECTDRKTLLTIVGNTYTIPSAPIGMSYRCSSAQMVFRNGTESLHLNDYQVQPWLKGAAQFGDVYDCVGFTTAPIWAGILVSFFLCGILSIGILALMDIKTPNRFESTRNKQLTFSVQD